MIWLTWRQFRTQAVIAGVVLAAAVVALAVNAREIAHLYTDSGAGSCPATGDCAALDSFTSSITHGAPAVLFVLGSALLYLVPPLIGVFWGAPLVARELEAGTHRLVWNQSITRDRWLGTKLAVLGGGSMVFAGALSAVVWWSSRHVDGTAVHRIGPLLFGARGIVPIGYAAFAFVLGMTAGIIIRRTVPAMAATLAVYVGAIGAMTLWGRAHLIPAAHVVKALDLTKILGFGVSENGQRMLVETDPSLPGAWVLQNRTVTATGHEFVGPGNPQACGRESSPKACVEWVRSLGLRQDVTYHPASHFWPLQWAEAGVFLVLAGLLVGFGFWWLHRRTA
jgi:hypothetical protein